jgi:hypothetical protein
MATWPQSKLIFDKLGYKPSPEQELVHTCDSRIRLIAGGERGGKSMVSAMDYMGKFWENPLLWLIAADYKRTQAEWNYILGSFDKLGIPYTATKDIDPGHCEVAGGFVIETKSAVDPRKIASTAPNMIIACEASQLDYETFLRLRGRLAEKRGSLLMSGTFESSLGWYPELFNRWGLPNQDGAKSFSLPTWSNLSIFPGGREDPEILSLERITPKDLFLERYGGIPCPPQGRVLSEFSNAMHVGVGPFYEYDPSLPVMLAVDPGYATAYAIEVVQEKQGRPVIVDEIFERNLVTEEMIKLAKQRPWWGNVTFGAVDVAATQHNAMPAVAEVWRKYGDIPLQSQKIAVRDSIERLKTFLIVNPVNNQPLLGVNAKARGFISECGGCENPITGQTAVWSWKKDRSGNVVGEEPEDSNNHATKAMAYFLVAKYGYAQRRTRKKTRFFE